MSYQTEIVAYIQLFGNANATVNLYSLLCDSHRSVRKISFGCRACTIARHGISAGGFD